MRQYFIKTILFIFIVFFCCNGKSQGSKGDYLAGESIFRGGARLGFTASQISGDDMAGWNKFGGYGGIFVDFAVDAKKRWRLQPELNFIMKGSNRFLRANADGSVGQKYVLTLMYIEVPIMVQYRILKWLEAEAGPSINFLFYSKEKDNNGVMPGRQSFRFWELGFLAGFNFIIKENYGINLRWETSVLPVRVPDGSHSPYRMKKKQFNDVIAISFYYTFGKKN